MNSLLLPDDVLLLAGIRGAKLGGSEGAGAAVVDGFCKKF